MAVAMDVAAPGAVESIRGLPDKCGLPRIDVEVLARPRLWDLLETALQSRTVLITAPAGFGKTVLCASWLSQRRPGGRMAWVTLDTGDRKPARFREYVYGALAGAGSKSVHNGAANDTREYVEHWMADLGQLSQGVTLVLDDVHQIAGSRSVDDLELLVRHVPPTCRVILLGRRAPGVQVARLRLAGDLATIGPTELSFTPTEVEQLLRAQGLSAGEGHLAQLMADTRGWAAGLRLILLSQNRMSADGSLRRNRTYEREFVTDYVRDEFLAMHPDEIRGFLLRTSVADTVTAELAEMLSGLGNSMRILDQLAREHGFVEAVDGDAGGYRYHPMIRDVLRGELGREFPRELPVLHHAMGRWHRQHGRPAEALRSAVTTGDKESVYDLLAGDDIVLLGSSSGPEAEHLLASLAVDRASEDPSVLTALAAARLRSGDSNAARALLEEAGGAAAVVPGEKARLYALKHAALRLAIAIRTGRLDPDLQVSGWHAAESAQERLGGVPEHRARAWLLAILGISHLAQGGIPPARHALHQAERDLATVGPRAWWQRVAGWLAIAEAADGRLNAAGRLSDQAGGEPPVAGLHQMARALVLVEQAERLRARELFDEVHPWPAEPLLGEPAPEAVVSALQLRLCHAEADHGGALSALGRLRDTAGAYAMALAPVLAAGEIAVGPAASGAEVEARLAVLDRPEDSWPTIWPMVCDLLRAWRLIDLDPGRAIEIAREAGTDGAMSRLVDQVSALLIQAVAHRRLGQRDIAARRLDGALALAAPEGLRQVFIDGGTAVRALLTVLLPTESRYAGFAAGVVQRFEQSRSLRMPAGRGNPSNLTESEQAVMRYLSSHMTNEEIAGDLCLSINTVKTHLRSIYRKLGVGSRRAAIAAASARGLI